LNDLAYFGGFCLIQAIFFFLHPYSAQLNVATSKGVPLAHFPDVPRFRRYRVLLAGLSVATFALLLFAAELPELAIILGALLSAAYVALDYRVISREAPSEPNV